ncbi:hypothetical protein [Myroides sp. N17-2]|uniref:hypothetical protein n=1 Tax=Myroides sp. N17-2 TaxID=2030799 RepID=UPI000EFB481B|nr:hypothetical protein [Myroides sp. N17-2]
MKLIELMHYFREADSNYKDFCKIQSLNVESEVIEIYMRSPLRLENDLGFFDIEETGGTIDFEFEGIKFSNLFDFYFFLDAISELNNHKSEQLSDQEVAERLFRYVINNA